MRRRWLDPQPCPGSAGRGSLSAAGSAAAREAVPSQAVTKGLTLISVTLVKSERDSTAVGRLGLWVQASPGKPLKPRALGWASAAAPSWCGRCGLNAPLPCLWLQPCLHPWKSLL